MSEYYTLGAQLPMLKKGDYRTHTLTSQQFVSLLLEQATKRDRELVELLLLRNDNALLLQLLRQEEIGAGEEQLMVLGEAKLRFLINAIQQKLEAQHNAVTQYQVLEYPKLPKGVYPQYMVDFVESYLTDQMKKSNQPYFSADILLMQYAEYVQKRGNKFLREWFELEYQIAAIFAAMTADKFGLDRSKYILGNAPIYQWLREGDWDEITYSTAGELYGTIKKIAEEDDLASREQKIDDYKWSELDEVTFTDIFSINAMLAYLIKLQILERWEKLDKLQGEQKFKDIVASLYSEFKEEMSEFKKSLKQVAKAKRVNTEVTYENR